MTFPILVEPSDGQFAASLVGEPRCRTLGRTRSQAVEALKLEIDRRVAAGELVALEVATFSVSDLAGKYEDDPTLRSICDEVYQKRDSNED